MTRMFQIKQLRGAALCSALALAGISIAPGQAMAEKVLKFVPQTDLKTVDPFATLSYPVRNFAYLVYDTLFAMDANLEPQPQMVDSWTVSDDRLVWTFKLRDGLKWHDGAPVTAADCIASLKRWSARDGLAQMMAKVIDKYEAVDDGTFAIHFSEPFGPVIEALARPSTVPSFMMPERLAMTDPFENNAEAIGSGPFKFLADEWNPGSKLVFVKNEDYIPRDEPASFLSGGKVVNFDRVEWVSIPDATTASSALAAGEVDWFELPPSDLLPMMAAQDGVEVKNVDPMGSQAVLRMNFTQPPFDNKAIRQAVLSVINQADYMTAVAGDPDNWLECPSIYPCGTPLSTETGAEALMTAPDIEAAKQKIIDAGYAGEKVVIISASDVPIMQYMAYVTLDLYQKLGLNVELQATDQGAYFARRNNRGTPEEGGWNTYVSWVNSADFVNPIGNVMLKATGADGYTGWPDLPNLEALRSDWLKAATPEDSKAIAADIQTVVYDEVVYIPLGQFKLPTAYRSELTGVIEAPMMVFWNVDRQ